MNLARSSLKIFLAKTGSTILVFLGLAFFTREIGTHQLGVFFLFQAFLQMLTIPVDMGIRSAVVKRVSEGDSASETISTAILLKLVPLSLFSGGILLLSNPINAYLGADLAVYLVLVLLLREFAMLFIELLKGELRVGETALPMFFDRVVFVGTGAFLLTLNYGVFGLVYGLLAGSIVMLLWSFFRSSVSFGVPSWEHTRSLFGYSKYAFISSVGGYFYNWMDVAIIGFVLTQSHVSIYEISWRVTSVVMLFSTAIATSLFPQVSRWDSKDALDRIEAVIPKAIAPVLFFVIPAFFGVSVLAKDILRFTFGPEYTAGWVVLVILMSEKLFHSIHIILGRSLQGIDKPDLAAKASILAICLNLLLNVVLIYPFGIVGAAVATAVSFVVNSTLHAYYLSNYIYIDIPYRSIGGSVFASLGMVVVLWVLQNINPINGILQLAIAILLGAVAYFGFASFVPTLRSLMLDNAKRTIA